MTTDPVDNSSPQGLEPSGELSEFDCPRCSTTVREAFYGPCTECRATLRATVAGEAGEVAQEAYEPKMNVTPNAVALKE